MQRSELAILPLRSAVLCVNCEFISNATGSYCPACGSPSLFGMQKVLDRDSPARPSNSGDCGEQAGASGSAPADC